MERIKLPEINFDGEISLEAALLKRRSVREYLRQPLTLAEVGQLLWSAQGISEPDRDKRTAPSAGAMYPLETYLVVDKVDGLVPGVYCYKAKGHELETVSQGPFLVRLGEAALDQDFVKEAAVALVFAAVYERTTQRYGQRGVRYVHIDVGHAAQNVYLQCVALGLGTVDVGAFHDEKVQELLGIDEEEKPLLIMPVGRI